MAMRRELDDKEIVVVCVTAIIIFSMIALGDVNIVTNGLSGLFGVAVGRGMKP